MGDLSILMGIFTKETGKTIKLMDLVLLRIFKVQLTLGCGLTISNKGRV